MSTDAGGDPSFEATIRNGRTIVTLTGDRNVAVVVRSRSGERIYLPPEDVVGPESEVIASPYQPGKPREDDEESTETPYDHSGERGGRRRQSEGSRIIHPEPATEVRLLRD